MHSRTVMAGGKVREQKVVTRSNASIGIGGGSTTKIALLLLAGRKTAAREEACWCVCNKSNFENDQHAEGQVFIETSSSSTMPLASGVAQLCLTSPLIWDRSAGVLQCQKVAGIDRFGASRIGRIRRSFDGFDFASCAYTSRLIEIND